MTAQPISVGFISGASLSLTRKCRQRCGYCSFRQNDNGVPLLSMKQIETDLNAISRMGITEVTFEAGEAPQEFPEVVLALRENGCESLGEYLIKVSEACLARELLPVFSLGEISPLEARQLAQSAAMQKICIVAADLTEPGEAHEKARGRHPAAARHQIEIAHEAGLPYRLSFLIGIGESPEERERAIADFGRFCAADPLLQDVELHPFQPQSGTEMRGRPPLSFEPVAQAMAHLTKAFPVHARSIAPHLFYHYPDLIAYGANDLGVLPLYSRDPAFPTFPLPPLAEIRLRLSEKQAVLAERLSLTTVAGWQRRHVLPVWQKHQERLHPQEKSRLSLIDDRYCFICGSENPYGLRLSFRLDDTGGCSTTWVADPRFQGYSGIVHGGIISSLLDEVMAHCLIQSGVRVVTAELTVRFLRPAPLGEPLTFAARQGSHRKRIHQVTAAVTRLDGTVIATAEGKYAEPR